MGMTYSIIQTQRIEPLDGEAGACLRIATRGDGAVVLGVSAAHSAISIGFVLSQANVEELRIALTNGQRAARENQRKDAEAAREEV